MRSSLHVAMPESLVLRDGPLLSSRENQEKASHKRSKEHMLLRSPETGEYHRFKKEEVESLLRTSQTRKT